MYSFCLASSVNLIIPEFVHVACIDGPPCPVAGQGSVPCVAVPHFIQSVLLMFGLFQVLGFIIKPRTFLMSVII